MAENDAVTPIDQAIEKGFAPPVNPENAVVYFVRVSNYGGMISFEFFHDKQFIGKFKRKNYIRYECPAGQQLLWASSEGKEFVQCDLKAGEVYVVLVNIKMGIWKARVGLEPMTAQHPVFERAKTLVKSKAPVITPEAVINSTQEKLEARGFIAHNLGRYEHEWKTKPNTKIMTENMSIPKEAQQ